MLEEYMKNIGYDEEQISFIMQSYPIKTYTESSLLSIFKNLVNFLHRNGFDNKTIVKITNTTPNTIMMSPENYKERMRDLYNYGFNKMEVLKMIENYPYILEMSKERINNKFILLEELGFSKEDSNDLLVQKTEILNKEATSIRNRMDYFKEYGYSEEDITSMINEVPDLIDMNLNTLNHKLEELRNFGFTDSEIRKITIYLPELYIYTKEDIDNKTKYLKENGYTTKNIINTIKKLPIILNHKNIERLEENIENLETLGFGKSDIVPLTEKNPYILLYSKDMISDTFKMFLQYGYYNAEVIHMIKDTPLLITYNMKELQKRMDYYKEKNLLETIKYNSKFLLYSLDFIKRREMFSKAKKDYFITDEAFQEKYKKTREDILREV